MLRSRAARLGVGAFRKPLESHEHLCRRDLGASAVEPREATCEATRRSAEEASTSGRRLPSMAEARSLLNSACAAPATKAAPAGGAAGMEPGATMDWREMAARAAATLWPEVSEPASAPLFPGTSEPASALLASASKPLLTDSFGRAHSYLRISLTERCNLRCQYCMPAEGVDLTPAPELLTSAEIVRLAALFARAGVSKVRLTGGEPTLRKDLVDLVGQLAALPGVDTVALTTNGITLARQLDQLLDAGLTHLNVSLDTLRAERFERLVRRRGHSRVLRAVDRSLEAARDGRLRSLKVNVVVQRGVNDDEIGDFVRWTKDQPLNVRFIEWMPFDGNVWTRGKMVSFREMFDAACAAVPSLRGSSSPPSEGAPLPAALQRLPGPRGEVARNFGVPGHVGTVSFIASMTKPFCGDCNRLRLMADGNLKVCLFGASEVSLRDALRGGASERELLAIMHAALGRKRAAHAGMFELAASKNRAMVKIGG